MPDETITWYQILIASVLTGGMVWLAARRANWQQHQTLTAAICAALLIGAWRLLANLWDLNADFLPLVSVGDAVCLVVGAAAPAVVSLMVRESTANRWLPFVVGGLGGFVINVVVL